MHSHQQIESQFELLEDSNEIRGPEFLLNKLDSSPGGGGGSSSSSSSLGLDGPYVGAEPLNVPDAVVQEDGELFDRVLADLVLVPRLVQRNDETSCVLQRWFLNRGC